MSDINPKRAPLEGFASEIFKLVSRGATPKQWAVWLRVPLEHAAADGNIELFNALIGAGANGGAGYRGCEGRTLFDAAARGGNAEVVSALVAAGAQPDVDVVSAASGTSALYLATSLGHEEAARRLVKAGACTNFRDCGDGLTVISVAAQGRFQQLVDDLLLAGAEPNTRISGRSTSTPLHIAARLVSRRMVSALLTNGADKNALDFFNGKTPLFFLEHFDLGCPMSYKEDHLAVVNTLLAAGADVNIQANNGSTALMVAAGSGPTGAVHALLGHGANVGAVSSWRSTALHHAAEMNHWGAIDALIDAGADIELKDMEGLTPLGSAARYSCCQTIRALLRRGSNFGVQNNRGDTLLHMACLARRKDLLAALDLLLRSGADETAVNKDGNTPEDLLFTSVLGQDLFRISAKTLERACLLFARAPNDRAWRRRGWLVMLYSRASRARTAGCDCSGHGSNAADDGGGNGNSTMAGSEQHAGTDEGGVAGQAGNDCAVVFGGDGGGLRALVSSLIGLELEGVFRTVVGFL